MSMTVTLIIIEHLRISTCSNHGISLQVFKGYNYLNITEQKQIPYYLIIEEQGKIVAVVSL